MKKTSSPRSGGRPRKFDGPSHRITVTLPKRTLQDLETISTDRAQAIVKATEATMGGRPGAAKAVDVVEMIPGHGLIVVGPSAALAKIPWLSMVEIAPARYLLVVPSGTAVEVLEVAISDAVEHLPAAEKREKTMLENLKKLISGVRRSSSVTKAELLIVKTS
ncbi:MAG: hypothetical protein U1G05_18115 [Kiritimatiellia bacterium]